jgi:hypothetical protein
VISNLSRNYGAGPIILTGFLRSKKIVNDTLAAFSEAIFEDYKSGYFIYPKWGRFKKFDSTDIPRFIKGRSVIDTTLIKKLAEVEYFADPIWTAFGDPLECYRGSFLDPTEFKYYHYEQRDMIDESGNKIIKIMFDQKPGVKGHLPKGEIYIDPSVYAIRKIFLSSSPNGYEWYLKHNDESKGGWNQSVPVIQSIYTFNNCNGTWSLQSKAHYLYITYSNSLNNETLKYHREMELVIISNIRDSVKISTFDGDKKLGFNTYWEEIIEESDSNYWQNFNYIPIEEVLQNDIMNMSRHDEN